MPLLTAVVVCCLLTAALFLGLWFYYDHRDNSLFERARRKTTFFCIHCGTIYTKRGQRDEFPCPKCARKNSRLKF